MTWQEELLRLHESASGAAAAIHPQWREQAPEEVTCDVRALANRIRKLLKGQDEPGWWPRHPTLQRLLADAVGFDQGGIRHSKAQPFCPYSRWRGGCRPPSKPLPIPLGATVELARNEV